MDEKTKEQKKCEKCKEIDTSLHYYHHVLEDSILQLKDSPYNDKSDLLPRTKVRGFLKN